jgi:hypothetical protein
VLNTCENDCRKIFAGQGFYLILAGPIAYFAGNGIFKRSTKKLHKTPFGMACERK